MSRHIRWRPVLAGLGFGVAMMAGSAALGELPEGANVMCPVMPADEALADHVVRYEGEEIFLCCQMCVDDFNADPETYVERLEHIDQDGGANDHEDGHDHAHDHNHDHGEDEGDGEAERIGDPYPLSTCPVSGEALGSMGDPVVHLHEGREVRFCCAGCIEPFEEDPNAYLDEIDAELAADQREHYPLEECLIAGAPLGSMGEPFEMVFYNRLIRFCCAGCDDAVKAEPVEQLARLDEKTVEAQKGDYALGETCVVSGEGLADHGEPVDVVVANRLIRLCCPGCERELEADPARFLQALADGEPVGIDPHENGHDHDHGDGHHEH